MYFSTFWTQKLKKYPKFLSKTLGKEVIVIVPTSLLPAGNQPSGPFYYSTLSYLTYFSQVKLTKREINLQPSLEEYIKNLQPYRKMKLLESDESLMTKYIKKVIRSFSK